MSLGICVAEYVVKRNAKSNTGLKAIKNNSNRSSVGVCRVTYY